MQGSSSSRRFVEEVLAEPGGENLLRCQACGTCAGTCLVTRVNPRFNPRRILKMVTLGMREEVLASPFVWLCSSCDLCYPLCPQNIHISAIMRAIRNIATREGYRPPGPAASVESERCSGCGQCATACPYDAIDLISATSPGNGHGERVIARVDESLCMNCGICAATCPSGAIDVGASSREQLAMGIQAGGWLRSERRPRLVLFCCEWNQRAMDDLKALESLPNVRTLAIPCTGQLDHALVLAALTSGVDGVLVVGCAPGECHYTRGNLLAQRRIHEIGPLLEAVGIGGERLRVVWISRSERKRIQSELESFVATIEHLGASPILALERRPS